MGGGVINVSENKAVNLLKVIDINVKTLYNVYITTTRKKVKCNDNLRDCKQRTGRKSS